MKLQKSFKKFELDVDNDLENFKTLHSYAFQKLSTTKEKMMSPSDYKEFGQKSWNTNQNS